MIIYEDTSISNNIYERSVDNTIKISEEEKFGEVDMS